MSVLEKIEQLKEQTELTRHERIVEGIIWGIKTGRLKVGDKLPSINQTLNKIDASRVTVIKALDELKKRGIIESRKQLGYFVISDDVQKQKKALLLLRAFNPYHENLYSNITQNINTEYTHIDLIFHHRNPLSFKNAILNNLGKYSAYAVTPFEHPMVKKSLALIPDEQTIIIGRDEYLSRTRSYVTQNFDKNLLHAMEHGLEDIKKYKTFYLINRTESSHPKGFKKTFLEFCKKHHIEHQIINAFTEAHLKKHAAYFCLNDTDMFAILRTATAQKLTLGRHYGILSYNDSPLREFIKEGINTISPDYQEMGRLIAKYLENNQKIQITLPTHYIKRLSL